MNTGPAAICLSYGFDDKRIQETIAALGMHARLGESAELIRREVIGDKAEEIATACLAKLAGLSDASLLKPGMDASAHKQILVDHLRRLRVCRILCKRAIGRRLSNCLETQ